MQNPSCIDLLLTNNVYAFQQTITIFTGLSNCHNLVLSVLKTTVLRCQLKDIAYRDYKQFDSSKRDSNNLTLQAYYSSKIELRFKICLHSML